MSLSKILAYAQSQGSTLILSSLLPDGFTCHPAESHETRMARVLEFTREQDEEIALAEVAVKQFTRVVRGKEEVVRPHGEMRQGAQAGTAAGAAGRAAGEAAYKASGAAAWAAGRQDWPHPDAVGGHKVTGVYTHPQTGNALYDLGNGLHAEGVPGKAGAPFKPGAVMKSSTGLQKPALAKKGWKFAKPPKPPAAGKTMPGSAGARQAASASKIAGKPAAGKSPLEKVTGQRPKAGVKAKRIQAGLAAQQQDYMQRHGFNIDPKDWHQDWVPPHEDRIHPEFGPPSGDIKDLLKSGREGAEGTAADPIDVKGDTKEALRQLAQGKHVRLNRPSELTLIMQAIAQHAAETEATGNKGGAPDWDFGRLSVKGTNLFAAQSKGIRRINMPQFSGMATPGSHAAQVAGGPNKFADLTDEFEQHLKDKGIAVTRDTMPASHLKATQSELVGAKVAGFANAFLHGNPKAVKAMSEPIMVTKDGYVIDGHHRWGANMLIDAVDGKLGDDAPMNVRKVDMEIGAMIPYANHWAQMNGIQSAAASAADTGAALKK